MLTGSPSISPELLKVDWERLPGRRLLTDGGEHVLGQFLVAWQVPILQPLHQGYGYRGDPVEVSLKRYPYRRSRALQGLGDVVPFEGCNDARHVAGCRRSSQLVAR